MRREEILSAITAAKKEGSFTIRIVFTPWSEIFRIRFLVVMINGGAMAVDDKTMMKLQLVATTRRWQDDTDRVVTLTMCDDFDEREFVARFRHAIEGIEVMPRTACMIGKREGLMGPKGGIRQAMSNHQQEIRIVIPRATSTDILFFMALVKQGDLTFIDQGERRVFEDARRNAWALGGRLSAAVSINKIREHTGRRVLSGAHARVVPTNIRVTR